MNRQRSLFESTATDNDRSVSPVIGVILMVAVTVIIAAVIGAAAFGFTDRFTESPPQANLQAEEETVEISEESDGSGPYKEYRAVTVTHSSGDDIDKNKIRVSVNGEKAYATARPPADFYGPQTNALRNDPIRPWDAADGNSITAGDSTTIILGTNIISEAGYTVSQDPIVFFHGSGGGNDYLVDYDGNYLSESSGAELSSGDTIRVIWESGDKSTNLMTYDVS